MVVKNLLASAGSIEDAGLIPGLERSPGGGHGNPLQYSCLGNSHGQRSQMVERAERLQGKRSSGSPTGLEKPKSELRACQKECAWQMLLISSQDGGKAKQINVSKDPCPALHASSVTQSCPVLCNPMDCSPPSSSVHGILQARILERVAMPSSRGSS